MPTRRSSQVAIRANIPPEYSSQPSELSVTGAIVGGLLGAAAGSIGAIAAFALVRLVGDRNAVCSLEVVFTGLTDMSGASIAVDSTPVIGEFRRGNARQDGTVNIADVLFGAQYLAGLRSGCTLITAPGAAGDVTCMNPVNLSGVSADGASDLVSVADYLFIAQQLVGLWDDSFRSPSDLVAIPDANLAAAMREALGKPPGEAMTAADLAALSELDAGIRGNVYLPKLVEGLLWRMSLPRHLHHPFRTSSIRSFNWTRPRGSGH